MSLKISAMVVGRNEGNKLVDCLTSLSFCDEIIYGDLDSSDNSIEIAEKFHCRIFRYKKYGPSCEYTQTELIKEVKNDWVIMLDPDEVIDPQLAVQIQSQLPQISLDNKIGDVYVPWQFYFGKKKLKGTVWGFKKEKGILINKNKYEILPVTHYGRKLKPGFSSFHLRTPGTGVLHHYWMDDTKTFITKHKKYLRDEGRDRFNNGQRISIPGIIYNFFYQFFYCFFFARGYRDGFTGLFLSIFWTWYSTCSNISLYLITSKQK